VRGDCKKCNTKKRIERDRANPEGARARVAAWTKRNPWYSAFHMRRYRARNPELASAKAAEIHQRNREHRNAQIAAWKKANPGLNCAYTAKRNAAKLKATPKWANHFFIEEAYQLAALRTKITGFQWHVDHIVPLQSKLVCGLHVEHNLRVIPAMENQKKFNKWWPDMPTEERS
jgi:hypothetical protein